MPTELLIIGDSHTRALQAGCAAHGIEARTLTLSGNAWSESGVEFCPERGLRADKRKWVGSSAARLAGEFGVASPFAAGLPVLLSCMNLGRLAGRFHWRGHEYLRDAPDLGDDEIPTSPAVLAAYVEHTLARQLELVRGALAQGCDLVVIGPPSFTGRWLHRDATTLFGDLVRAAGARYFNPWEHRPENSAALPAEHVHPDGRHGSEAYGEWVLGKLVDDGLIARPAKRAAKRA